MWVRVRPLRATKVWVAPLAQVPEGEGVMLKRYQGGREIGFALCRARDGRLVPGPVAVGTPWSVEVPLSCPPGTRLEGIFHTHPGGVPHPSPQDVRSALQAGVRVLCIDADGVMRCWRVGRR